MIHDDYVSGVVGVIGADPPPHVRYECIRCEGDGTEEDGSTCLRCNGTKLEPGDRPAWLPDEC